MLPKGWVCCCFAPLLSTLMNVGFMLCVRRYRLHNMAKYSVSEPRMTDWKDEDVVKALQAVGSPYEFGPPPWLNLCTVNCVPYDDPGRDRSLSDHCGYNHRIVQYLAGFPKAKSDFAHLYMRLERLRLQGVADIPVVLVCKSGKHRSVAMACAIRLCVLYDDFYDVAHCHMMTDLVQACRCRVCPMCDPAKLATQARLEHAAPFFLLWPHRSMQGMRT